MIYCGVPRSTSGGCKVEIMRTGGSEPLPLRLDLANHSPTGFAWGISNPGATQLALALLAHALEDDDRALKLYQDFKFSHLEGLDPNDQFFLDVNDVRAMAAWIEKAQKLAQAA